MALSFNEKATQVVRLLLGTRYPQVLAALQRHGFNEADLDEGWALLRALGVQDYGPAPVTEASPDPVPALDAWENRWYPVARATLERHDPTLARKFFHRLPQTEGITVLVSVAVFLKRLQALESGAHGEPGKRARRLLARRGLTAQVVGEAQAHLDAIQTVPQPAVVPPVARARELDTVWAWYREWSRILRTELEDGRLLRGIGLTPARRRRK